MDKTSAKKRISELSAELHRHGDLYHRLDQPEISDKDYDDLFDELLGLEENFPELKTTTSPTQRVGGAPLPGFTKVRHEKPMLSLQNTYSVEDIIDFDRKIKKQLESDGPITYFCAPKFDGVAIELVYENGQLTEAITRGDGTIGEGVLHNIRTISSLPLVFVGKNIPPRIDVRGEVLIYKKDFEAINESQLEQNLNAFANPRNAAAGTLRQLDSKVAAQRNLRVLCYAPGHYQGIAFPSQLNFEDQARSWGLPTVHVAKKISEIQTQGNIQKYALVTNDLDEVVDYYNSVQKLRHEIPFEIDGVVIKVNDFDLQDRLGFIARSPRWAFAAKFEPEQEATTIIDIQIQVGRTGALTPVAIMEPVSVGGVTITYATLHNQDEINRKDVRVGDRVWVRRAGDVIPEIIGVVPGKRSGASEPFQIPDACPACGEDAVDTEGEAVKRCVNLLCPAMVMENLKHFVSRNALNIEKLGSRLVEALFEAKLVERFSDIYKLSQEDILTLERQGQKSSKNIIDSINASRAPALNRFIYALGIRFVGQQTAKTLAKHFQSLEQFRLATEEVLLGLEDVGPKVAASVTEALADEAFQKEIDDLLAAGVDVQALAPKQRGSSALDGLSFVVTGTLPLSRDKIHDALEHAGGSVLKSVSKKVSVLIAGESAGSKLAKAEKLGLEIWDWEKLKKKLPHL